MALICLLLTVPKFPVTATRFRKPLAWRTARISPRWTPSSGFRKRAPPGRWKSPGIQSTMGSKTRAFLRSSTILPAFGFKGAMTHPQVLEGLKSTFRGGNSSLGSLSRSSGTSIGGPSNRVRRHVRWFELKLDTFQRAPSKSTTSPSSILSHTRWWAVGYSSHCPIIRRQED